MDPHSRKKLIIISAAIVLVIVVVIVLLIPLSNYIIKHQLERAMGANFSVERISLSWGSVGVYEPRFLKGGQTIAYVKRIILKAHFLTLLKPGFSISSSVLEEPSMKPKEQFLGIPRSLVVRVLETNNHQIVFDFILIERSQTCCGRYVSSS